MAWLILGLAALIIGVSKTSVSGFGALAVALFAIAMPTKESTAAVLLLLIVGDLVAVRRYRRHCDWKLLARLLPWVLPGLALGAWLLHSVDDDTLLRRIIAGLLLVSLLINIVMRVRASRAARVPSESAAESADAGAPAHSSRLASAVAGVAAGFTTMTANAAGPVMTLYLLAARVDKMAFVGTGAWYFLIVNVSKVPFSAALHLFPRSTLLLDLALAPVVLLGTWLGTRLLPLLSQQLFEWLALGSSLVAVVLLLIV